VGAFSFGHGYGGLLGVLAAMGLAHDVVQPAVWKRAAHIPPASDKKCSVAVAARQLPEATPYLTRVKDHGRAEGLLLALQGLRWQQGGARVLEHKDIAMESED
jgi:hypothetical protein